MKEIELERRDQEILEAVIQSYVETGEPVGSRTVARSNRENLSAATIRNVMAELEERNLLVQPHASAGRVPTDLGYRAYVDALTKHQRLPAPDEQMIASFLQGGQTEIHDLFGGVSKLLSRLSNHMGVVVSPHIARVRLRDIEFVRLGTRRVLVIVIAASGMIHNKVVEIDDDHEQEKLDKIGKYLTEEFKGHTLSEVRDRILDLMSQEKALYDTLLRDALKLGKAGLAIDPGNDAAGTEVFLDGTANLLSEPEFASVERLKALFRTFEEKHQLLRVLHSCLEKGESGVQVLIGKENPSPEMSDCTLVASSYGLQGQTLGTLGIIGPTRMEYARAIALVDSVSRLFSRVLSQYQG